MAIDRHSPKRARDPEGGEPRLPVATATQSTSGSGNPGVQAAVSREGQDVNEEGYETLTFINNTGTRYSHWLRASNANRPRAYGSTTISDPFARQANLGRLYHCAGGGMSLHCTLTPLQIAMDGIQDPP